MGFGPPQDTGAGAHLDGGIGVETALGEPTSGIRQIKEPLGKREVRKQCREDWNIGVAERDSGWVLL